MVKRKNIRKQSKNHPWQESILIESTYQKYKKKKDTQKLEAIKYVNSILA